MLPNNMLKYFIYRSASTKKYFKNMAEIINEHAMHKEYASKATGNAGLTLGIIGTSLGALSMLGGNVLGGLLGTNTSKCGAAAPASSGTCPIPVTAEEAYIERSMCQNYLDLTKQYYDGKIAEIKDLHDAFYALDKQDTNNSFALYKNQRDTKDELDSKISALNAKVDVMSAIRPYQDALINAKIDNVAQVADFNLFRRTCRMLQGELVLPDTSVSGFPSYTTCNCGNN